MYILIRDNPSKLYEETINIVNIYNNIEVDKVSTRESINYEDSLKSKECFYYWMRKQFNLLLNDKDNILKSVALFIFLNKTCFRGLYRVGKNGFNVPFGFYKNPEIINKEHIMKISKLIKNVSFEVKDFKLSLNQKFLSNDFIYLEPPYFPENPKSFVSYTEDGFNLDEHSHLFNILNNLSTNFLLSNSDVDFVKENFDSDLFVYEEIIAKRSINSKNPDSKTKELFIKNYLIL